MNQDMIIFKHCGYPPNKKNFIFEDGEVQSNDRITALHELNKLKIRVLQMNATPAMGVEWWLIETE